MNNAHNQTELLLMVNTRFFSRQLERVNQADARDWYSKKEQLMEACWDGLTTEILPECFTNTRHDATDLREIIDGNAFIDLQFCEGRKRKEKQNSLNPYVFMQVQAMN